MKHEKIIIKITGSEKEKIEAILDKMASIPSVEVSKLTYGQLGSEIIASFDIDDAHFAMVAEKIYAAGLNLLPTNDKISQVLEFLYGKYGKRTPSKTAPAAQANMPPSSEAVQEYKNSGRYEELLKIMKLVNIDQKLRDLAKESIAESVKNAIEQLYNAALVNKHSFQNALGGLLKIASDITLKSLNIQSMQKKAGFAAIAICENYSHQVDELIKIGNNAQIPNVVNVKAVSKFWEIISVDIDKHQGDVALALKNLNLRILENAYDVAYSELNDAERKSFNDFRAFYRLNKK